MGLSPKVSQNLSPYGKKNKRKSKRKGRHSKPTTSENAPPRPVPRMSENIPQYRCWHSKDSEGKRLNPGVLNDFYQFLAYHDSANFGGTNLDKNMAKVFGMLQFGPSPQFVACDDADLVNKLTQKYASAAGKERVQGFF